MNHWKRLVGTLVVGVLPVAMYSGGAGATSAEPILVGGVFGMNGPPGTPEFPEILAGVQGAIDAINADGGVNGRPIELVVCADEGDANVAAACGRTLVDEGVVAVVGSAGRFSANWFPITAAAGIPFIGPPIGAAELSEPLSFPPSLGTWGGNVGAASIAADLLGVENLGVAYVDVASAASSTMIIDVVLELKGLPPSKRVPVPIDSPDMSSYAAAVTDGTDAVYMAMTAADADKLTQAIRQSGSDVPIIRSAATFAASNIETLGPLAEGIYQPSQYSSASDNPEVVQFLEELAAADDNATPNDLAASAWSSVYTFADAASRAETIDPAGLVAVLESGETFVAPMTAGPVQFTTPVEATGLPRAFNTLMTFRVVENGEFVTANDNQFIDAFAAAG